MIDEIKDNLVENIEDQNPQDSLVARWSCLDFDATDDKETQIEKLEKIFNVYGCDTTKVLHTADGEEFRWNKLKLR